MISDIERGWGFIFDFELRVEYKVWLLVLIHTSISNWIFHLTFKILSKSNRN